jgi:hypothetical protein
MPTIPGQLKSAAPRRTDSVRMMEGMLLNKFGRMEQMNKKFGKNAEKIAAWAGCRHA